MPRQWDPIVAKFKADQPIEMFEGGSVREASGDRPRPDLLITRDQPYVDQMLTRDAVWVAKALRKYPERDWEGFADEKALARCEASLGRHWLAYMAGDQSEDHAAALRWNVQCREYILWRIQRDSERVL